MYRALISFSGLLSMVKGEVREIPDKVLAMDLLNCHYIEVVEESKPAPPKDVPKKKTTKKKTPKGG